MFSYLHKIGYCLISLAKVMFLFYFSNFLSQFVTHITFGVQAQR